MSGVTTERKEYTELLPEVKKNRDCTNGQRAVKEETTRYLKPLQSMLCKTTGGGYKMTADGLDSYTNYLSLALFFNASGRTVDGYSGLIFRKDPVIELPSQIDYLIDNIASNNETLISQLQKSVREAMITPRSALLVDYPDVQGEISRADAEALNLRPRILHFPFESIINWYFETINNEYQLSFVVLRERTTTRAKGTYEVIEKDAFRVLEMIEGVYHHSLWDESGTMVTEPTPVFINGSPANKIPLFLIEAVDGCRSLIDDLVDVNLNHYNMFASYANKEHTSGFPIFWETGASNYDENGNSVDSNNQIGPGTKWTSESTEANFGVLETSGDGGSLRQYLEDRKQEMAALGAEMLQQRTTQAESGESKKLDKVAQNATVADVANTVSRAYKQAFEFAAMWVGADNNDIEIQLNTDYIPQDLNPQTLTALMVALQNGDISYDTFWRNMQKGELADPAVSAEEERARIDENGLGLAQNDNPQDMVE